MWWPRPRWKNNLFTHFTLLLIVTITSTISSVMADEEGQNCATSNMSAVVWTTALCTMLLVLVVIAIYFLYCKRREHDWSSLWWKNNPDKNLVLQTSGPTKDHQLLKKGGTDNPAFLADSTNIDDHAAVGKAGFTRITRVPSSAIDSGSLGIELSSKEDGGRTIYMCKHSDGSKDRLASLRLVFDNRQKQRCSASPDLGGALVELSREYGLIVELETTDVIEPVAPAARGPVENGADEATLQERSKSNILSTLRGKAQSLWNHGRFAFKTGETSGHTDKQTVGEDVENGPVKESAKRSSCSAVTTVDETAAHVVVPSARMGNGSARYRTLEYGGASAADVTASDGVQCCTINSSAPTATTIAAGGLDAIDGDDAKSNEPSDQQKSAPPPPPPPRKYSTPVVIPSVVPASTCGRVPDGETLETTETAAVSCAAVAAADTAVAATTTIVIARGAADVATSSLPVAGQVAPRPAVENEFRASDDHYWCTTTAMASPLSTFGKRSAGGDATCAAGTDDDGKSVETTRKTEIASSNVNDGTAAGRVDLANDRGGVVCSRETVVIGDATCSIEDASLPSYSSDEDDDESGVLFTEKVEPSLPAACAADPSAGVECRSAPRGSDKNASDRVVATTDCSNGRSENNADVGPVNSAVRSAAPEPPRPATKLPSLRPSLSSPPLQSGAAATTSSSPTNNNGSANHSPIVSKIPVRRQSAGSAGGTPLTVVSALIASNGGTAKKAIPLPLSRSGSRLAMWTSAN